MRKNRLSCWYRVLLLVGSILWNSVQAQEDWRVFGHSPDMALLQLGEEPIASERCKCANGEGLVNTSFTLDSVIDWNLICTKGRFEAIAQLASNVILKLEEDPKQLHVHFGARSYRVHLSALHGVSAARVKETPYLVEFIQDGDSLVVSKSRLKLHRRERRNIDEEQLVDAYREQLLLVLPTCSW